ncbi:MAG TPA: hypothetical protein VGO67_15840 [Verrucomicrobiae bacterium]|jgi:hypothetical protein
MHAANRFNLARDLVLPTVLFAALGGMTWAVRGCSGFGASAGCLFAGVTWGAAWWFIARDQSSHQSRRYASGWIILAMAVGFSLSGNRGWMQWPSFFDGRLQTNTPKGEFVSISRSYGFLWLFIAGVPWAGIGACLLSWCSAGHRVGVAGWILRLSCAFGFAALAVYLFDSLPAVFLPQYNSLHERYADLQSNPNLRRLINDNRNAIMHFGFYLGCLFYEAIRRDWKNVLLIATVGLINGLGWSALQTWSWAKRCWPGATFNFWRCWESSAGISIGLAYGVAYFLVNRPRPEAERSEAENLSPNIERFVVYLGLVLGLGISVKNGIKGWANIYLGNENYWNALLWKVIGPLLILALVAVVVHLRSHRLPRNFKGDMFPNAYGLIWLVLIIQNTIAQLVTGPWSSWNEVSFSLYYVLLFLISAVIVHHLHCSKSAVVVERDA